MPSARASVAARPAIGLGVYAYPSPWRVVGGFLFGFSRGILPIMLYNLVVATDPPMMPQMLMRTVAILSVLPGFAVWLIRRALSTELRIEAGRLVLSGKDLRVEVPCESIARVVPWRIPLPGPGFTLWLKSGRRFRYALEPNDLAAVLSTLAVDGEVVPARQAAEHPTVSYARARTAMGAWRWTHWFVRFVLFSLPPAAVLFNAHQHIAYGGVLGQYYLLGLRAYLDTFAFYWVTMSIYLVLYASLWRGLVESSSLLAAWIGGDKAHGARRATEVTARLLYYGGVPVLLAIRFLP
jgi:hypothetical protein